MTKIKDLAVLAVESAFCTFLIDEERYELLRCIRLAVDSLDEEACLQFGYSQDDRVNSFIRRQSVVFAEAARCLRDAFDGKGSGRPIHRDRARRCEATLRFWCEDVRWSRLYVADAEHLTKYLWQSMLDCFRLTERRLSTVVPEGQEVST